MDNDQSGVVFNPRWTGKGQAQPVTDRCLQVWGQFFQNVARCNNNTDEGIMKSSDDEFYGLNGMESSIHVVVRT